MNAKNLIQLGGSPCPYNLTSLRQRPSNQNGGKKSPHHHHYHRKRGTIIQVRSTMNFYNFRGTYRVTQTEEICFSHPNNIKNIL